MKEWKLAAIALLLSSCGWISFRKTPTGDEIRLQNEIRAYYADIQRAFAAGNAQALSGLFDPAITRPMAKTQIDQWCEKFFAEHGRARFKILDFSIDELGFSRAVVSLRYSVETPDGKGNFSGAERDELIKRGGRWYTAGWEKLP